MPSESSTDGSPKAVIGTYLAAPAQGCAGVTGPGRAAAGAATAAPRTRSELGRELGDAGGPLLVASIATTVTLGWGYSALALLTTLLLLVLAVRRIPR